MLFGDVAFRLRIELYCPIRHHSVPLLQQLPRIQRNQLEGIEHPHTDAQKYYRRIAHPRPNQKEICSKIPHRTDVGLVTSRLSPKTQQMKCERNANHYIEDIERLGITQQSQKEQCIGKYRQAVWC